MDKNEYEKQISEIVGRAIGDLVDLSGGVFELTDANETDQWELFCAPFLTMSGENIATLGAQISMLQYTLGRNASDEDVFIHNVQRKMKDKFWDGYKDHKNAMKQMDSLN